jgi:adhesin/invasin
VWTLGDQPGRQTLLASVERVDSALAVQAEAEPVAANTRVTAVSENVSGSAGQQLADPVELRVTDSTGRALPDVPVTWLALDGGSVEALDARTDSLGQARARWALGPKAGSQRVRAQVGSGHGGRGVPPFTLRATALAGAPVGLTVVSGDAQRGAAGAPLPKSIVVRVVDATGNGVADAELLLSPSAGSVPDTAIQADSLGIARIKWTLGRSAGDHTLAVHIDGVKKLLKVSARALPAAPANLTFDDVPADGRPSRGKKQLVAIVTDAFGNPVPDTRVSFSTRSGSVSPARAVSDAQGRVHVSWTLGTKPGEQSVTGSVPGTDVRESFVAQSSTGGDVRQAGKPAPIHAPPSKPAPIHAPPSKPAPIKAAPPKSLSAKSTKKRS